MKGSQGHTFLEEKAVTAAGETGDPQGQGRVAPGSPKGEVCARMLKLALSSQRKGAEGHGGHEKRVAAALELSFSQLLSIEAIPQVPRDPHAQVPAGPVRVTRLPQGHGQEDTSSRSSPTPMSPLLLETSIVTGPAFPCQAKACSAHPGAGAVGKKRGSQRAACREGQQLPCYSED